jgi:hypothetical protein
MRLRLAIRKPARRSREIKLVAPTPALRAVRHTLAGWPVYPEKWDVVDENTNAVNPEPFDTQAKAEAWIELQGARVLDAWAGRDDSRTGASR